jgi:putative ABC transport system permease protein
MLFLMRILLNLFPAGFRRKFGPDLLATFDDRWSERAGWRLAARTIGDMTHSAFLEHLSALNKRLSRPGLPMQRKGDGPMRVLWQDLKFGTRTLLKSPGFALAALLTLTLGIGATTAIYSVVNAVLFKGLPYPHADRLVFIAEALPKLGFLNVAWPDFVDWRAQNQVFTSMAAFQPNQLNLVVGGTPKAVPAAWVSSPFFALLGAKPVVGRTFTTDEDQAGATPVAVVSYRFWRNELKGDPDVAGKPLATVNGSFVIAGVLSPDFQSPPWDFDIYLPIGLRSKGSDFTARDNHPGLQVIAEIRDGTSLARVRADMNTIMNRLALAYPKSNRDEAATIVPLTDHLVGDVRTELLLLLGAVLFVLLIAAANVAHLTLARATARHQEFAIRAAMGASRGRLMRQALTESTLLSFAGGAAGLFTAVWSVPLLTRMYPGSVPGLERVKLDSSVLLFTFAICILAGLIFGLAPMLQAGRAGLHSAIRDGVASKRGRRIRSILFVAEIAIAIVVTVGAGLLFRSLTAVLNVDPGFRADRLLALDVVRSSGSPLADLQFFEQAVDRIGSQPGVESASAVMCPPLSGSCWTSPYALEGGPSTAQTERPWTALNMVTPGYFRTAGIRLIEGRVFDRRDDSRSMNVAVINEAMLHALWPHGGAIGKRLDVTFSAGKQLEVVGIVADVKQFSMESKAMAEVFVPAAQMPVNFMTIVARTSVDPESLVKTAADAIHGLDKGQPVSRVTPMMKVISSLMGRRRFAALLLGLFSALAILMAAVGVSGVMAYTVAQRTREFGIRIALGAHRLEVLSLVLKDGVQMTAVGVAIGVGASWILVRFLSNMLFDVKPHDWLTFLAVPAFLAGVALAGCLLPARRAARVDPIHALRHD